MDESILDIMKSLGRKLNMTIEISLIPITNDVWLKIISKENGNVECLQSNIYDKFILTKYIKMITFLYLSQKENYKLLKQGKLF